MPSAPKQRRRKAAASPIEAGRSALADALPDAIQRALDNYRLLADSAPPADPKAFQQQQTACKAALQHVDALLKLADAIDAKTAPADADHGALLARAEAAFSAYSETEAPEDGA